MLLSGGCPHPFYSIIGHNRNIIVLSSWGVHYIITPNTCWVCSWLALSCGDNCSGRKLLSRQCLGSVVENFNMLSLLPNCQSSILLWEETLAAHWQTEPGPLGFPLSFPLNLILTCWWPTVRFFESTSVASLRRITRYDHPWSCSLRRGGGTVRPARIVRMERPGHGKNKEQQRNNPGKFTDVKTISIPQKNIWGSYRLKPHMMTAYPFLSFYTLHPIFGLVGIHFIGGYWRYSLVI